MAELLLILAVSSLTCVGWKIVTTDGMVFGFLSKWSEKWPDWLAKPLVRCVVCYSSIYGTLLYLALGSSWSWVEWPVFMLSLSFLNYLLYSLLVWVDIAGDHEEAKLKVIKHTYKHISF